MDEAEVRIKINAKGEIIVEGHGEKGAACIDTVADLIQDLGGAQEQVLTRDYFSGEKEQNVVIRH